MTKKGNLSNPEMIGLYTRKYENIDGIPKRANETQMNAIIATKKKIELLIAPLNVNASLKKSDEYKQKKHRLSRRKTTTSYQ